MIFPKNPQIKQNRSHTQSRFSIAVPTQLTPRSARFKPFFIRNPWTSSRTHYCKSNPSSSPTETIILSNRITHLQLPIRILPYSLNQPNHITLVTVNIHHSQTLLETWFRDKPIFNFFIIQKEQHLITKPRFNFRFTLFNQRQQV